MFAQGLRPYIVKELHFTLVPCFLSVVQFIPADLIPGRRYKKQFGFDYKNAFIYLKNEIVNFWEDVSQKNYNDLENYRINSKMKNRPIIVYFYDRFFPICTESEIDKCLKSVSILKGNENKPMVYKNLALVEWKKTVPELADWSNQMVLDFCRWLDSKNIVTNKEETVILWEYGKQVRRGVIDAG